MSPVARALVSLVVIASSAIAMWVAVGLRPAPPPPPSEVESVFSFAPDAVVAIAVETWQGSLRASRVEGRWQVAALEVAGAVAGAPEGVARPDASRVQETVSTLVRDVAGLPEVSRFPRDGPLSEFGLDEPRATIEVGLATGSTVRLQVGARTTSGAGLYARIESSDEILQIGGLILNEIGAALFQLRGLAGRNP